MVSSTTSSTSIPAQIKKLLTEMDRNIISSEQALSELTSLTSHCSSMAPLFCEFFNASEEHLSKRCSLVENVILASSKKQSEVSAEITKAINQMVAFSCDFPLIFPAFANIICPLLMRGSMRLADIKAIPPTTIVDQDDEDDRNYFIQEVKDACRNHLKALNHFIEE